MWNCMGGYIAAGHNRTFAPTMFNIPRWWYEKFAVPNEFPVDLVRASSHRYDFNKEEIKKLIASTSKTLYLHNGWEWSGIGREEITKEQAIEELDAIERKEPREEHYITINEYCDAILLNVISGLPF